MFKKIKYFLKNIYNKINISNNIPREKTIMKMIKSKYQIGYLVKFIDTYAPIAIQCENQFSIPAEAMLAEAALESGWGRKVVGNNFFGIKPNPSWTGKTYQSSTMEWNNMENKLVPTIATFKLYDTPLESFKDYCEFIITQPRYSVALEYAKKHDTINYVKQLALAGYATAPDYAKDIMDIINWNLVITETSN